MNESVTVAKNADARNESPSRKSDKRIHSARYEHELQINSLRYMINSINCDAALSVENIATQLSSMHTAQRAPVLLALQQTHGNQYVQKVVTGIQTKLKVGQPRYIYEQEADRVAEQVMRISEPVARRQLEEEEEKEELLQTKPLAEQITTLVQRAVEDEEKEETVQTKEVPGQSPEVTPEFESRIQSLRGGGQALPEAAREFFEPRFGHDFSQVRLHTDMQAAESVQAVNARAFTVGPDIAFGSGQYAPETTEGRRLLAHELTHVVQQASGAVIQRVPDEISNTENLRQLLQDDQEDAAIELMGRLSAEEVQAVLTSREFKELATDTFNNDEMYRGVRAMRGDLYRSLEWMFDEGTDWSKVRGVITRAPSGKDRVRTDNWMKEQFVGICNNEEMAEAVGLLGGTLLQQLTWMKAEGSSWELVKARIQATTDAGQKTALYGNSEMRDLFVSVCNNEEMAEAVGLLGGTLLQQLTWMKAEGSSWELVKARIQATTDAGQKTALYGNSEMRDLFVSVCNNEEMAEAVGLLGGTLLQKSQWVIAEGIDAEVLITIIHAAPLADRQTVLNNSTARGLISGEFSGDEAVTIMSSLLEGSQHWDNPPSNDFYQYFMVNGGTGTLPNSSTMNCWESIMYAAYLAGEIDVAWIIQFYTQAMNTPNPTAEVWNLLGFSTSLPQYPASNPSPGQLVFYFGTGASMPGHVVLSLGGDEGMSLWNQPNNDYFVQRIDLNDLSGTKYFGDSPW